MMAAARRSAVLGVLSFSLLVLPGCGDPATEDDRGYTKAPLEDPGFVVNGEPASEMDAAGDPERPVIEEIPAPTDSGAYRPPAQRDTTKKN